MKRVNNPAKTTISDIFVSTVVILRPDLAETVDGAEYIRDLNQLLYSHYSNYEIIVVDNSLPADVVDPVSKLLAEIPCVRVIKLSRKYSHDMAAVAGLESSIGDYTVITDPALDPIGMIPQIIECNKGTDIVQGVASVKKKEDNLRLTIPRRLFYWYSRNYVAIDVPTRATYFISLSRRAVAATTSGTRRSAHLRFMIKTIGYSYETFQYETLMSPLRSRSLSMGFFEAADIISSYSVHPLRFMSWVGLGASVLSAAYSLYVVIIALTKSNVAEGWVTMSLEISGLFFVLFLILVVLAEYIGKLLAELRQDPKYHVVDEQVSTVSLARADRKNISNE